MTSRPPITGTQLHGRRVLLAASVPSVRRDRRFQRAPDAHVWIPEAVIVLTRSVLAHDGILVMGAHPTISPLVALVAGEYRIPSVVEGQRQTTTQEPLGAMRQVEPRITVYQSRVFEGHIPAETSFLAQLGFARLIWTDLVGNEIFNPHQRLRRPPAPRSVRHMRERMINETIPDAIVCIGGMEGVIDEALLFAELRPGARIYALATTGGAASLLPDRPELANRVRAIDLEVLHDLERRRERLRMPSEQVQEPDRDQGVEPRHDQLPLPQTVPYPLIMQMIIDELGEGPHDVQ
jgi:hypothetical protein